MSNIKERIIGAVTVMSEEEAVLLWDMIAQRHNKSLWENIESIEPDEWDLQMIKDIKNDSDCGNYISSETLKQNLGLDI